MALQSGAVKDLGQSWVEVHVSGPAVLGFWWSVSSEANHDFLRFLVDGAKHLSLSGEKPWHQESVQLPAGDHVLRWSYEKDATGIAGKDAGWIGCLSMRGLEPPVILSAAAMGGWTGTPFCGFVNVGNDPLLVDVTGELPEGLHFSQATRMLEGIPTKSGTFMASVSASNEAGSITQDLQIVIDGSPLETGVDTSGIAWTTSVEAPWFVETATSHDGVDAAQSGCLLGSAGNPESWVKASVAGPGDLAFWWRSDGGEQAQIRVEVDDGESVNLTGDGDWDEHTLTLPVGNHVIRWVYARQATDAGAAWLDQVTFTPGPALPVLASHYDISGVVGEMVTFVPAPSGGPVRSFSWDGDWPVGLALNPQTGKITGKPIEQGDFNLTLTAENTAGSTTAPVAIHIISSFEAWARAAGTTDGPKGDPDQDGLSSIVEYILGSDPTKPSADAAARLPAAIAESATHQVKFAFPDPPLRAGTDVAFEATDDLGMNPWMVVAKRDPAGVWTSVAQGWSIIAPSGPSTPVRIQPPPLTQQMFGRWRIVITE